MERRTRIIFILFLTIALAGIAGWAIFFGVVRHGVREAYRMEKEADEQAREEYREAYLSTLLESISSDSETLSESIVSRDGAVAFFEYVESLGRTSGAKIKIESIRPPNATEGEYEDLNLSLSFSGSWKNVATFLGMLENLPFKFSLGSVRLSSRSTVEQVGKNERKTSRAWDGRCELTVLKRK